MQPPSEPTTTTNPPIPSHKPKATTPPKSDQLMQAKIRSYPKPKTQNPKKKKPYEMVQFDWPPQLWVLLGFHLTGPHNAGLARFSL